MSVWSIKIVLVAARATLKEIKTTYDLRLEKRGEGCRLKIAFFI